jgi:hypothetical protein
MARTARRQQAEEEIRRAAEALRKRAGVQGRFEAERKRTGE